MNKYHVIIPNKNIYFENFRILDYSSVIRIDFLDQIRTKRNCNNKSETSRKGT